MKSKSQTSASVIEKLPLVKYLKETRIELTKVTWPNRQQIVRLSGIVIAVSAVTSAYLGALDYVFVSMLRFLLAQ